MTDRRDIHPDSDPAENKDERSDLEQMVEARSDDVERGTAGKDGSPPLDSAGIFDGVAGTGGVTKNQDVTQQ